ncbi:hypothetical protein K493DRAFT_301604 [Basidiobolus meristosporus CBS 931.73]|uniref:3D domain-containing protein n=1 Tax=Basidiobolus meristosporus CBS 931.73 TaxID=1314790 RepID=A0A1Y1YBC5_9FUNG|nr:hypothetical protein K493DRAFT_309579 [Basidiobolus meristosporus CBS 931.73]ORX95243.1 hypothetical protein K493DRAFT_301604 [Basidiobolus meristosporus CBS 931.73]|eukprot:ORX64402.1 hypothetical protein K493DRAFT_309579 [Basidiobolus meristosporus CBS 931.73]
MSTASKLFMFTLLALACFQSLALARRVDLTYYWISEESDFSGPQDIEIQTCSGETLATVSHEFAEAARMEGTAILNNGDVINLQCSCDGGYSCFSYLNKTLYPYGLGAWDNALVPFVSVAANNIPRGTTLMVKQLKGVQLPDGQIHNGCVRVDDQGWGLSNHQIDFMVGLEKYYVEIDNQYGNRLNVVDITRTSCTPGVYAFP